MKGYVVNCCVSPNGGAFSSIDLIIRPDGGGGIDFRSSEFQFNLSIEDAQDVVESVSGILEAILSEDSDA